MNIKTPRNPRAQDDSPIIFFDGVCGLCNGFVDFLFEEDKDELYQFSPLQSDYAAKVLPAQALVPGKEGEFKSIVLYEGGKVYMRSEAVLRVLTSLGGIWGIFYIFRIFPAFLRDPFYNVIAANRYRWFGKRDSCRMPTPSERKRFVL